MKKTISIIASTLIALTFSIKSNAQRNLFQSNATTTSELATISTDAGRDENVNAKVLKDFNRKYTGAENVQWSSTERGGFVGRFNTNDVVIRSYYNSQGNWQYSISGYGESKLKSTIRNLVKSVYYDFDITYVQEIDRVGDPNKIYLVQIQDRKYLKTLRVVQD